MSKLYLDVLHACYREEKVQEFSESTNSYMLWLSFGSLIFSFGGLAILALENLFCEEEAPLIPSWIAEFWFPHIFFVRGGLAIMALENLFCEEEAPLIPSRIGTR
ncbi:LOW QUALITY PROTEIN: hypothetical protein RJ641_012496, partial [Dillenia turbinata]